MSRPGGLRRHHCPRRRPAPEERRRADGHAAGRRRRPVGDGPARRKALRRCLARHRPALARDVSARLRAAGKRGCGRCSTRSPCRSRERRWPSHLSLPLALLAAPQHQVRTRSSTGPRTYCSYNLPAFGPRADHGNYLRRHGRLRRPAGRAGARLFTRSAWSASSSPRAIEHVDGKPIEAARAAGATPFQVIWHAVLPQVMPQLADNDDLSLGVQFQGFHRARRSRRRGHRL